MDMGTDRQSRATRVAVVGAGVVGLAAAAELRWAGAEVRLYEKAVPGQAQSQGKPRIFRRAHSDPWLVELAMQAERLWRGWESRFGRRLVGDEGLIAVGEDIVPAWGRAMHEAGASHRLLSPEEGQAYFPLCRSGGSTVLFDPGAGAIRVRRTNKLLSLAVGDALRLEEVCAIETSANGCLVRTRRDA